MQELKFIFQDLNKSNSVIKPLIDFLENRQAESLTRINIFEKTLIAYDSSLQDQKLLISNLNPDLVSHGFQLLQ